MNLPIETFLLSFYLYSTLKLIVDSHKKTLMLNVSWNNKDNLERSGEQDSNILEEICTKVVNQITGDYTNSNNTLSLNIWGILYRTVGVILPSI